MTRAAYFRVLALGAFAFPALSSGTAQAGPNDALIYWNGGGGLFGDITTNLSNKLIARGATPTAVTVLPGSLSPYGQLWDNRASTALNSGERSQYLSYLQSGGTMFLMGENPGFGASRNSSILGFLSDAGGGSLTLIPDYDSGPVYHLTNVLSGIQSPNAVTTMKFAAAAGSVSPGNGQCLTRDTISNACQAIVWAKNTMTNAANGTLVTVFDINFMETVPNGDSLNNTQFLENLVNFVTVAAGGGGGSNFAALGGTPYQKAVGGAFNTLFGNTSGALSSIMTNIAGMSSVAEQQAALEAAASSFPQVPIGNALQIVRVNLGDINRWISASPFNPSPVMAEGESFKVASAFGNSAVMTDVGDMNLARLASAVTPLPTWTNGQGLSAFLNIGYVGGSVDATTNQTSSIYNGIAATGGAAYALDKDFSVGGAVGINSVTARLGSSRGNGTTNTYNLIGFGHFADGTGLYADATGNLGYIDYDYDRNISVGAFSATAHGKSQGWQIGTSLGGGYDFNVDNGGKTGVMRNVTVGPFAQLQYQYAHLAGFTETGAGTASLSVGSQGVNSLSLKVGGRFAGEIESHLGSFIPSLSVAYEREFLNGARSVDTNFVGGTAAPFATPIDAAQKNFAVIGVGLTKALDDGFTVGLSYGGRFNLQDKQHAVSLRGKYDF